jgi:DNA-binding IclR family transcriptional regulator
MWLSAKQYGLATKFLRHTIMNKTAIKAMLSSTATISRIQTAIRNTSKNGYSVDHVKNKSGVNFLAFRVRDGKLEITNRKGVNITQLIVSVALSIKLNKVLS